MNGVRKSMLSPVPDERRDEDEASMPEGQMARTPPSAPPEPPEADHHPLAWLALGGLGLGAAVSAGASGSSGVWRAGAAAMDADLRLPGSPPAHAVLGVQVLAAAPNPGGGLLTNDGTVLVHGLAPGARWWYRFDGDAGWSPGNADNIPGATSKAAAGGRDGDRTVVVYQTDVAGLDSAGARLTFTLDQTPPVRPGLRLKNDTGIDPTDGHTTDPTVVINRRDPTATLQVSLDGKPFVDWTGDEIPRSAFDGLQGTVQVRARLVDAAGNVGPTIDLPVEFHVQPPPAPLLSLAPSAVLPV